MTGVHRFGIFALVTILGFIGNAGLVAADGVAPGADTFQIRNKKHGDLLRPRDANSADGTPIVLYPAQNWKCLAWKLEPKGSDAFAMQNVFTGKTLAGKAGSKSDDATTAIVQVPYAKAAGSRPAWHFEKQGDGAYKISDSTGASLTAAPDMDGGDVRVKLAPWKQQENQEWEVLPAAENFDM